MWNIGQQMWVEEEKKFLIWFFSCLPFDLIAFACSGRPVATAKVINMITSIHMSTCQSIYAHKKAKELAKRHF
jgi:hypothetical protein